ncbi:hypothetical protein [Almyronema epifaneia]|uniref:Uncharacterized protein n=1 Tax=Almyronema epifaneia S1 TaxID=2991925 RepID=A0ABW6IJ75_9CYAN
MQPKSFLARKLLTVVVAASFTWILADVHQPVWAETEDIVIDMPVSGSVLYSTLIEQAEQLASGEVSRQFSQNSDISEVRVVVMGSRYGEIIPILATKVSRSQWQDNPQITVWTDYYSASYTLLQRHDEEIIALAPARSITANPSVSAPTKQTEIDAAYDEGRLSAEEAQIYLDYLD